MKPIVVVTGGAGFIGSHTTDLLIAQGNRVVVLDDFRTGKRANLARWADPTYRFDGSEPSLEILPIDITEGIFAPLAPITGKWGPIDRIVHLAAQVSVVASLENPLVDVHVNYRGTVQVLEYARRAGVKKVVLASSAAVYGDVTEMPVREDAEKHPVSPYGIDKLASEHMLWCYSAVHGVPTTALRFFNVYGPRQDPSSPYSGVISIFADRARAGKDLLIFGDGEQSRDFVYVGDVARGLVAALEDRGDREVVNIGTGREISVNRLAEVIVELCGGKSQIHHAPARAGEILRSLAAVERAEQVLGFRAQVALEDGLRETLA